MRRNYEKACPDCGALGLERCKTKNGKDAKQDHMGRRVRNARIIHAPMPAFQREILERQAKERGLTLEAWLAR